VKSSKETPKQHYCSLKSIQNAEIILKNLKLQSVSRQHLLTEWPYKWVKIIKDCTGWNFRMWPLAVSLGWLLIRKCIGISQGQKRCP